MVLFSRLATCRNLLALLVRRTVLGLWYLDRVKSLLIALILEYCTEKRHFRGFERVQIRTVLPSFGSA
jgi:hypothetical protein